MHTARPLDVVVGLQLGRVRFRVAYGFAGVLWIQEPAACAHHPVHRDVSLSDHLQDRERGGDHVDAKDRIPKVNISIIHSCPLWWRCPDQMSGSPTLKLTGRRE